MTHQAIPHPGVRILTAASLLIVAASVLTAAQDSNENWFMRPTARVENNAADDTTVRLRLGTVPAIDRVRSSASFNGAAIPTISGNGESRAGFDGNLNPAASLECIWPAGRGSRRLGLSLDLARRSASYQVNGGASPKLPVTTYGLSVLGGWNWPVGKGWSVETMGRVGVGLLRAVQYGVSPRTAEWTAIDSGSTRGGYAEAGLRAALVASSHDWLWGIEVEYTVGQGYARWHESGNFGDSAIASQYAWYGFASGLFVGTSF